MGISDKKYHIFKVLGFDGYSFKYITTPKIGSVTNPETMTKDEAYGKIINTLSNEYGTIDSMSNNYSSSDIIVISFTKTPTLTTSKKITNRDEMDQIHKEFQERSMYNTPDVFCDTPEESYYLNYYHANSFSINSGNSY